MNWSQLKWANEEAIWALLALLLFGVLTGWARRWHTLTLKRAEVGAAYFHQIRRSPVWLGRVRNGLFILGWCALVLALMQPRYGLREARVSNVGIDIAVVLDVSKSMSVADVVPNRLEASKIEIGDILRGLRGGRVALIPFSGIPFVQCPLTSDTDVIRTYLKELKLRDMPRGGTNLGRALNLAHQVLTGDDTTTGEGGTVTTQYQGSRYKAILLLSDGENHEGAPEEFIETLKASNIAIFTVGIGSASGTLVPKFNPDGTSNGFMQDESGTPVISSLNEGLLRTLAERTGGSYFHYADRSIAQPLLKEIDRLEKQEVEERFMKLGEERFQWPLSAGFLFLLASTVLAWSPRRTAALLALVCSGVLPLESYGQPTGLTAPPDWTYTEQKDVERGKAAIEEQNGALALEALTEAAQLLPESAALHYNKGLAQLLAGKALEAKDSFERALSMERGPMVADHNMGLGIALSRHAMALEQSTDEQEKLEAPSTWESAIEAFEVAVMNGAGENAAWNLEVALIGKCRSSNDPYEENNSREKASELEIAANPETGLGEGSASVTLCMGDEDWFFIPFGEGDRVELEFEHGGEGKKSQSALDVFLDEGPALATLGWNENQEQSWKFHNLGKAGGAFVRIYSLDQGDHTLDLAVTVRPPCATRDDALEENDRLAQASPPPSRTPPSIFVSATKIGFRSILQRERVCSESRAPRGNGPKGSPWNWSTPSDESSPRQRAMKTPKWRFFWIRLRVLSLHGFVVGWISTPPISCNFIMFRPVRRGTTLWNRTTDRRMRKNSRRSRVHNREVERCRAFRCNPESCPEIRKAPGRPDNPFPSPCPGRFPRSFCGRSSSRNGTGYWRISRWRARGRSPERSVADLPRRRGLDPCSSSRRHATDGDPVV